MKLDTKDYIVVIVIVLVAIVAGFLSAYQYIDGVKKDNELIEAQKKISELQNETIKQVVGYGYPRLSVRNEQGNNLKTFIKGSTDYPIYGIYFRISDAEKLSQCGFKVVGETVEMNKSSYDSCRLFNNNTSVDVNDDLLIPIDLLLPKKNYYLLTEFMTKNIRNVQYSIIEFDGTNMKHSYKIYKVSKTDHKILELLEESNPNIIEYEYEKHFISFRKTVVVDFVK